MPHLIAGLVAGSGVRTALHAAIVGNVAYGAEINHLAGLAQGDVLRLRFAQPTGEREMRLVGHWLVCKAEQGPGVDRFANRLQRFPAQFRRQVETGDPGAEGCVQRFNTEMAHSISPNRVKRPRTRISIDLSRPEGAELICFVRIGASSGDRGKFA